MISSDPKIIMSEREFVERLRVLANRPSFYKNKYPFNLCYINPDGRTSADCVNLLKAIFNGYDVNNKKVGYYQRDLKNTGDCTEAELLCQCSDVSEDFSKLDKHARVLYMRTPNGHIGAYLGFEITRNNNIYNVIECTASFGGGIVYSWVDKDGTRRHCKKGVKNCKWQKHGLPSKWVNIAPDAPNSNETKADDKIIKPTLRRGNRGEYVVELQRLLVAKGYDPKGIDGIFGQGCEKAVRQFQKDAGLQVDGIVGAKTWAALEVKENLCIHKVKSGETLSGIAANYKTSVDEILKINPEITNPNLIKTGQMIKIPSTTF